MTKTHPEYKRMTYQVWNSPNHKWEVVEIETDLIVASFWAKSNAIIACGDFNREARRHQREQRQIERQTA